jgi:hypothetical protein
MASTEVVADWAWISKDPSAGIGYSVLQVSTDAVDFGAISSDFEPGAPSSTIAPESPDAPPWVTYGPGGGRDGVLISVSVRDPWTERDHTGRPVRPQRLFVMRYPELADADASFQTIWEAVRDARVPAPDGAPLPLTVAGQSPDDLIPVVEANFESLAAIAAALLDGPVAIGDASHLPRERRLALLDAVAALLPYGFRADLSASSSVNNTVKHQIRLVLADFANPDQQLLSLATPQYSSGGDFGGRYLAALQEKRKKNGTAELVRHLWSIRQESGQRLCSFRRPGFALAALHELDFLGSVRDELAAGPVSPELIRKFFAHPDGRQVWEHLDVPMRDNAVRSLAGSSEAAAAILVREWPIIGNDVIRCANRDLDAGSVKVATSFLSSIGQADGGLEDRVLANLLVPERVEPAILERRGVMLIELLLKRSVPAPGEYSYTCDDLRFGDAAGWQARLVRDLLAGELAAGASSERAVGWVRWLCRTPASEVAAWERPDWVNALDFADPGERDGRDVRAASAVRVLIRRDQRAVPRGNCWSAVLLQLCGCTRRLTELAEAVGLELMELAAVLPLGDQSPLAAALRASLRPALAPETFSTLARLDVIRMLLAGPPTAALIDLDDEPSVSAYLAALHEAFRRPPMRPRLPELEERLLRVALSAAPGTRRLSAGSIELLNAWVVDPERLPGLIRHLGLLSAKEQPVDVRLSQQYWTVLGDYPKLANYAVSGQLITATDWTVRHPAVAFLREYNGEAVTTTRLAHACFEAWCAGRRAEGVIRTLESAGAAGIRPRQLDDTLRELEVLLHYFGALDDQQERAEQAQAALFECWRLIVDGALGPEYARSFGDYLQARLQAEAAVRVHAETLLFPQQRNGGSGDRNGRNEGEAPQSGGRLRRLFGPKQMPAPAGDHGVQRPRRGQRVSHANRT